MTTRTHDQPLLTDRQIKILLLLATDHTDEAVAVRLNVTSRTIRHEVGQLYETLGVRSRFGLGMAFLMWQSTVGELDRRRLERAAVRIVPPSTQRSTG